LIEPSALRAAKAKTFEAILVYPISEGAPVPETPHALIDPSALIAAVHPMIKTIPRFIQIRLPLSPLKPMVQSRRGVKEFE
jgi:hypothetical protein